MSTLLVENIRHEDAASPAITLLSNGNVGIGTNSSDEKLEISNTSGKTVVKTSVAANSTVGLEIEKTGSTTQSWLIADGVTANGKLEFYNTTDSRSIMTMINTGYVGIGSASPDAPLYIDGSVYSSPYGGLRVVGAGSGAGTSNVDLIADFGIGTSGSVSGVWLGGRSDETTGVIGAKTASGNLAFEVYQSGWKERMRINNNGNVGIGTDNPSNKLEIHHNDGYEFALKFNQGNNNIISGFGQQQSILAYATQGNGDAQEYYAGITFGLWDGLTGSKDGTIHFHTANDGVITNNLMIDGDGNVGIGTDNPLEKLQVNFTSTETHQSTLTKNTNTPGAWIVNQNNDDNMAGIHLATGSGTHFSSIVGARTNNSAHWGTHLAFYTHRNDTANLNTADERMRLDGSGSLEQYGSSVKSMYFPVFLESTQTHHIATATNLNNSTVVIATLEFATLYAYAGSAHSAGTIWASARRTNNNTAWRELNQATVNIGDTSYTPSFYWDTSNGQLKCTVGGSVQVTGFIRITYHACDITRVTN